MYDGLMHNYNINHPEIHLHERFFRLMEFKCENALEILN